MRLAAVSGVLSIFGLMASLHAAAQESPLVITGTVTEVKVSPPLTPVLDKNQPWGPPSYERKDTWFDVYVVIQFCNKGDIAVIVPTSRSFLRGTTKILFLELPSSDSKVTASATRNYGRDMWRGSDPLILFLEDLKKPEPPFWGFATIEPGTCYDSGDTISIMSGYKLETRPVIDRSKPPVEVAIPEHAYFKVQYSISMKDSLPVSEAKRRWGHTGKLLTTADGDFFFETDVIINKLPDQM